MTREEALGTDFTWLASDADGFVAMLMTAGGKLVPDAFLSDPDAYEQAVALLRALPATTTATVTPGEDGDLSLWSRFAERGVYAFDSSFDSDPYRLIAKPLAAVHVSALPAAIAEVAKRFVFNDLRFANQSDTQIGMKIFRP